MKSLICSSRLLLLLLLIGVAASPITARADSPSVSPSSDSVDSNGVDMSAAISGDTSTTTIVRGTVAKVSDSGFTVILAQGGRTVEIATGQSTCFAIVSVADIASLKFGDSLVIEGHADQDAGSIAARAVIRFASNPRSMLSSKTLSGHFIAGTVSSISPLTIDTADGKTLSVKTSPDIQILASKDGSLADLQTSSQIIVRASVAGTATGAVASNEPTLLAQLVEVSPLGMPNMGSSMSRLLAMSVEPTDGSTTGSEPVKPDYIADDSGAPVAAYASLNPINRSVSQTAQTNDDENDAQDSSDADDQGAVPLRINVPKTPTNMTKGIPQQ